MGFEERPVTIFTGHFGSGKTEVAINYVLKLAEKNENVTLVDMDIVNPYFCSREARGILESKGIKVIAPREDCAGAEIPGITAEMGGILKDPKGPVVVDLGGDEAGAAVLGSLRRHIKEGSCHLFFVVNPYRPLSRDINQILSKIAGIEKVTKFKVTGIVSNPNLGPESTPDVILKGHKTVLETAGKAGKPVIFTAVREDLVFEVQALIPVLTLKIYLRPPWVEKEDYGNGKRESNF